ncbi:hypothetical protein BN8_05623 [Fibrisoma limi BUZ 3]|uniref:Chromosome segregation protein SMC n=1 Tax=Fibrisoma limi BUZ 3 TaxID=1185876 RepID=I2GQX0_9BACT|nr:hypothetical protein [Fibrisoma limi]CCH56298.1 hypothetical protein BN8_05623 [Fibrisoma limi BUZ 3]
MEVEATSAKQGLVTMAIAALVGITALLAYLFMDSRNEALEVQKLLAVKVEQFASTQQRLDSISTVLDQKLVEVRRLGGSVAALEQIKWQLENDKKKLKSDLSFSIQQYNLKIKDYKNFLAQSEFDLQKLRDENGLLRSRTRALEEEKQNVLSENEGLKTEKEALTQTLADYSLQNAELKNQVTLASAMKAVNAEVIALAANGKERRGGSYKASRIDRLKISFIMPSNAVAVKNDKDIYIRILDANGAVVSESGVGGVIPFEGREIGYSIRQTVPFENNDQEVNILFRKESAFKPGNYTVEIYAEGFLIGDTRFDVK